MNINQDIVINKNNRFRIVIFTENFFPQIDGVVRVVDLYAKGLKALGYQVLVVAPKYKHHVHIEEYEVIRVPSFKLFGMMKYPLAIIPWSRKLKKIFQYDGRQIFHTHAPFFLARKALKIAKKEHVPIITTFHSKYYDDFYTFSNCKWLAKYLTKDIVKFYLKVNQVWAVSLKTSQTLTSYGYPKDIFVMENGTDFQAPDHLEEVQEKIRHMYQLVEDEPIILFVGRLVWQKNIRFLLNTFKKLDELNFKYHLMLLGDGEHEEPAKKYAESLNLKGRVSFLGLVSDRSILAGLYSLSKLHFFPSVYDNAPLVVREAAVMGLPTLLIKDSHSAEIVSNNISGFTEIEDETIMAKRIISIIEDKEKLQEVSLNAQKMIPIDGQKIVDKVSKQYEKIVKEYYQNNQ